MIPGPADNPSVRVRIYEPKEKNGTCLACYGYMAAMSWEYTKGMMVYASVLSKRQIALSFPSIIVSLRNTRIRQAWRIVIPSN
jgi:hypothetical protein